jgi:hypothetical protein
MPRVGAEMAGFLSPSRLTMRRQAIGFETLLIDPSRKVTTQSA